MKEYDNSTRKVHIRINFILSISLICGITSEISRQRAGRYVLCALVNLSGSTSIKEAVLCNFELAIFPPPQYSL